MQHQQLFANQIGVALDAHRIMPRLWQGADPPRGNTLRRLGIDVLVLCALECQPPADHFPGIKVLHAPMDDIRWVDRDLVLKTSARVAELHKRGARVLVCCHMGLNRSGIVSATTLWRLTGWPGQHCVEHVRDKRPGALFNLTFADFIAQLPGSRHRAYTPT